MKKTLLATATAVSLLMGVAAPAFAADIKDQQVALVSVDVAKVTDAYRATKIIGTNLRNDNKDKIGSVDDLLISKNDQVAYAVVNVGGFLGMGTKHVLIGFDKIAVQQDGSHQILVVSGATKDALKSLPEFKYTK